MEITVTFQYCLITTISGYKDEYDNLLGKWLDAILPKEGAWLRCFKASPNWKGTHFHSCDGLGPTVTFIRVQKNIFGGFLYSNWGGESKKLSNRPTINLTFKIKTTQQCKLVPGQEAFIYLFIS